MRHEFVINRDNGDKVKIVTLLSANMFNKKGYGEEQFALINKAGSDEWLTYHHQWSPKSISRQDYIDNFKPKTFFGVVSIGESLKAGIEARKLFFV